MRNMPTDSYTPLQSSHLFAELGLKTKNQENKLLSHQRT